MPDLISELLQFATALISEVQPTLGRQCPRPLIDFGELQQPVRRDTTRFFGTMSKVPMDWAVPAIKPEPLEPQPDEYGPATSPNCAVATHRGVSCKAIYNDAGEMGNPRHVQHLT